MLSPGCTVGNLKIGTLLGRGAMGEVYSGEQVSLRRDVAIKRIAGHLADDPDTIQRFAREAQCVAKINSPHVVGVYEFGQFTDEQDDQHYLLIMELVAGGYSLKSCIGTEITWQQASSVIMQVADGLAAASEYDVVHRDIKPDNIMLSKNGVAKLADFGLAKSVDSTAMTMEGTLMGTPNYMPPEACRGENVDARGDIYSLGATWYHLITGEPLFAAANTMALLRAHCEEQVRPIQQLVPSVPDEVAAFIMSCVAKDPQQRPENAEAIYTFLARTPDVPQKVPELIRVADAAKQRNGHSASTMATIVTGKPGAEATIAATATADAVLGNDAATVLSEKHAAVNLDQTLVSATSATVATNGMNNTAAKNSAAQKSRAPLLMLLISAVVLPCMVAGGYFIYKNTTEKTLAPVAVSTSGDSVAAVGGDALGESTTAGNAHAQPVADTDTDADVTSLGEAVNPTDSQAADTGTGTETRLEKEDAVGAVTTSTIVDSTDSTDSTGSSDSSDSSESAKTTELSTAAAEEKHEAEATADAAVIDARVVGLHEQVETALAAKQFKQAEAAYADLVKLTDPDPDLLAQISAGQEQQNQMAAELLAEKKAGYFALLQSSLAAAQSYPELVASLDAYQAAIVNYQQQFTQHLAVAQATLDKQDFKAAQTQLAAIKTDTQIQTAAQLQQLQEARDSLQNKAAAFVEAAIEAAVAGVEEGTSAGLGKSRSALRGAVAAAQVSGMETKLKSVMLKLAEIIHKRSESNK